MNDATTNLSPWRRRAVQATFWIALVAFLWALDTFSQLSVREQTGYGKDNFRLFTDQATSAVAVLLMIPFVSYWTRQFPIRKEAVVPAIVGHTVGTGIFAFGHYSLMVLFRIIIHHLNGMTYTWANSYLANLTVEYQKDIKIYLGIVAIVSVYRHIRRTPDESPARPKGSRKLLVQTGSGERVIALDEIDYLEAARNYVVVHVGEAEYLLRETMSKVIERLADGNFARTHRSFVVNIDKILDIRTTDSGHEITLSCGAQIPVSRGFRDAFKSLITM